MNKDKDNLLYLAINTNNEPAFRNKILSYLGKHLKHFFSLDTIPEKYEELKKEAKVLSEISRKANLHLAIRLKIIRDNKLYLEDNYLDIIRILILLLLMNSEKEELKKKFYFSQT